MDIKPTLTFENHRGDVVDTPSSDSRYNDIIKIVNMSLSIQVIVYKKSPEWLVIIEPRTDRIGILHITNYCVYRDDLMDKLTHPFKVFKNGFYLEPNN
jgi:hypothetical protein